MMLLIMIIDLINIEVKGKEGKKQHSSLLGE